MTLLVTQSTDSTEVRGEAQSAVQFLYAAMQMKNVECYPKDRFFEPMNRIGERLLKGEKGGKIENEMFAIMNDMEASRNAPK